MTIKLEESWINYIKWIEQAIYGNRIIRNKEV